jgi:hypothetical protein
MPARARVPALEMVLVPERVPVQVLGSVPVPEQVLVPEAGPVQVHREVPPCKGRNR